jgi:MtrB/PioB family decaheme-associated outer membrane protein
MNLSRRKACQIQAVLTVSFVIPGLVCAADENDKLKQLIKPQSTVNIGAGYLFNDNARFGQYTGLRDQGAYGIFNLDFVKRDEDTGTWYRLMGRNLGFENRDIRLEHARQGNWGYFIEFSQTPHYEPFTVNTAVTGIGAANLNVPTTPTDGDPFQLKTERQSIGFGRNEEKDGARIFGRGNRLGVPGPLAEGGYGFTPEPINSTIRRFGTTLDYNGKQLQLSGGYYGTMYSNRNKSLNITGGSTYDNGQGIQYTPSQFTPIALPPDNQSHQVFLSGGYTFSPSTRGTFKAAYTTATQTDAFFSTQKSAPGIGRDLDGHVDTALLQAGLSARPLSKLTVLGNFRFEDRNDKTPVRLYNPAAAQIDLNGNRWLGLNTPRSFTMIAAKLEASYAMPLGFRIINGIDYDHRDRTGTPANTSHRNHTDEISYRAELRRSLSETVTGTISYIHSERFGSPFLTNVTGTGEPFFNLIAPFNLADRSRDRVRLLVNWEPVEPLSLQLLIEESRDNYGHRAGSDLGLRKGSARNYSLDALYTFSAAWQATAWFSRNETHIDQTSRNPITNGFRDIWSVKLQDLGTSFGIGLNGKLTSRLELVANLNYSNITNKYKQKVLVDPQINTVPDTSFQQGSLRLSAKYALQKNLGLHLDYILDRFKTNEWTWTHWKKYADDTTLSQDTNQLVNFIGFSGYYSWQ